MKDFTNNEELNFKVDKKLPFSAPDGYFDTLPGRIQDLCVSSQKQKPFAIFVQTVRTQLALAAGFAAFVVLAYAGYFYIQTTPTQRELSKNDYIEVVSKRISDFDEGQLVEASGVSANLDSIKPDKNDQIIQYLLEENIDYVTLMEQMPR
jgi:hypothetical protein